MGCMFCLVDKGTSTANEDSLGSEGQTSNRDGRDLNWPVKT